MDYHGNIAHKKLHKLTVVFHIPIPDEDINNGGDGPAVNLRTAVFEYKHNHGVVPSQVYDLETKDPTEYAQLQSGALLEHVETFIFSSADITTLEKRAELDTRYNYLATTGLDELKNKLKYWNYQRDVS
jgi:hypothetical protein